MLLQVYPFNLYLDIPVPKGKMVLSPKSLAGPGYIILNAIRVMNIIGFLAVIAASIVMLIKTTTTSRFFFFDAVSHVITALTSTFLIISELCLFPTYFARNWPLLSPDHGFVMLSLIMLVIGLDMLGDLNKVSDSQADLGLAFWRMVISSGILIFILSFINLAASYLFRDHTQGITARMVRAHGATADIETPQRAMSMKTPSTVTSSPYTSPPKPLTTNALRVFTSSLGDRDHVLPSYHTSPVDRTNGNTFLRPEPSFPPSPSSRYSRATACTKKKLFDTFGRTRNGRRESLAPPLPLNISAPMGSNAQFAAWVKPSAASGGEGVSRPDSALHPSRSETWRVKGQAI